MNIKNVVQALTPPILFHVAGTFVHRQAEPGKEQPSEYYDATFESSRHYRLDYFESHYYPLWLLIADRIRRASIQEVLDIGCGPGQMAALLSAQGLPRYLGIDFSNSRIAWARRKCPGYSFAACDVFETDLIESASYEAVIATEFFEHVERDLAVIERIRSGARVFASVPNFPGRAHVRYFSAIEQVRERYASSFRDFDVMRINHSPRAIWFFFDGVKR